MVPLILVFSDHLTETKGCKGWTWMTLSLSIQTSDASSTCFRCAGKPPVTALFSWRRCNECDRWSRKLDFSSRATSGPQHFACSTCAKWLHGKTLWCTSYCPIIGLQQKLGAAGVSSSRCTYGKATCLLRQAAGVSFCFTCSFLTAPLASQQRLAANFHTEIRCLKSPIFFRSFFFLL